MPKRFIEPVENELVRLRLLEKEDLPMTLAWRNQDHIRKWFYSSNPINPEQHLNWYQRYEELDTDFVFIIEDRNNNYQPVGQVAVYDLDWVNKKAEYGRIMIGEKAAAGKGLARAATQLILDIAWNFLGLEQVYLRVFKNNDRAIALYHAIGFTVIEDDSKSLTMIIYRSTNYK